MSVKDIVLNLGSLEELNLNNFEPENISVLQIDPYNYGLLVYSDQSFRVSFIKLNLNKLIRNLNNDFVFGSNSNVLETKSFEIYLLNVFCLPFTVLTVICTKKSVWAVGQENVVNLKPYIEQALEKAVLFENDNSMDVDIIEEFQSNILEINIEVSSVWKYSLHSNDIYIGCHFLDYALLRCHKNSRLHEWELEFLHSNCKILSPDVVLSSFLNFPISFNTNCFDINSNQDQNEMYRPLIVFIHPNDFENHMFRNLFGINCSSPNVICLIGHPEGKLLWSLCDSSDQFQPCDELQTLFDIHQPIVGIFFMKDMKELEDANCMLIVGALGQLTLISPKKFPSFTQEQSGRGHTFWVKTAHVCPSIAKCDFVKDCLLCVSSTGTLFLSNLSMIFRPNFKNEEMVSAVTFSEFDGIEQMITTDRNKGLIILKTNNGNVYLTQLSKDTESQTVTSSIPSLMNDCLKRSNQMQELLNKKVFQNRLYSVVSKFASLKLLENILKEPMTFSISEVNEEPKKYVLVIDLQCLEYLNLDSELCHVSATVFTFFKHNNSSMTKTVPYKADEPTLCIEFIDTVLQPSFTSIFPLFVEVGLIVQLPENWKDIDCFKFVSSFLPFYIRIQTFMIHELNLLQSNTLCFPQSLNLEVPKSLRLIKELGMKRPISNILQTDLKKDLSLIKKFSICLSISSVETLLKNTPDPDPCKYIEKLLYGNMCESSLSKASHLVSKNSPISINVLKDNSYIVITLTANNSDSLIGLRIAVMETLLTAHNKGVESTSSSTYVNISATIYRRCEEISKSLLNLYGKDVESDEVLQCIINLYKELRTDISGKLPIL